MSQSVFNSLCETWRGMSVMGRIVAFGAVCVSVLYGGSKGDQGTRNRDQEGTCSHALSNGKREGGIGNSVLAETNIQSIPTNVNMSSRRARNWSIRGAWDDVFTLKFENDFYFPYGTNLYNAVKVFSQGYVIPFTNPYTSSVLADIGPRVSIIPRLSTFYYEYTLSNSYRFVWNNVPIGRYSITTPEPPQLNDFSLELLRSGDVITSSNGVVRTIERTLPFDWDRDGIINERDDEPTFNNGNHFGNGNILPDGANSNNYCWIDIVVSNSISRVTFVGDGESDYPDPDFVALPNVTYRVYFLIGKTYEIMCAEPIVIANKSSNEITVVSNADKPLKIVWSITYEIESAARSLARSVKMNPSFVSGRCSWSTNSCCVSENQDSTTVPLCNGTCECQGCSLLGFIFHYEGYKLSFGGIDCGCTLTKPDDGPYVASSSVSFSKRVVIFEDAYMNTQTESIPKRSTQVVLSCVAHGGNNGGVVFFSIEGNNKLRKIRGINLPLSIEVPSKEKVEFDVVFEGVEASEIENDVIAQSIFIDNVDGNLGDTRDTLTVVEVELKAVEDAPNNPCQNRHIFGISEAVDYQCYPSSVSMSLNMNSTESTIISNARRFYCPWIGGSYEVYMDIEGTRFTSYIYVYNPVVVCRKAQWDGEVGEVGKSGQVGMLLWLYIEPSKVSFDGIFMLEIPCDIGGPHSGYFNNGNLDKVGFLSHSVSAGAGKWIQVHGDEWAVDYAGRRTAYPKPWEEGCKEWDIPIGWGDVLGNIKGQIYPVPTKQRFTITTDGSATVEKYGNIIERQINNNVYLNGVLVK